MENKHEGILPSQVEAIRSLARSIERNGAKVNCVIAFGSRAAGLARPESDLDAFFLIDFESGDASLLSDEVLLRTKHNGQATTEKSGQAGDIHLFLYNQMVFAEKLVAYHDMKSSKLFTGIAANGVVIRGEEPQVEGKALREYIKGRLKD